MHEDTPLDWARDLFLAFDCGHTHFNAQLFRLLHKSDPAHKARLAMGFPVAVAIYFEWNQAASARDFFANYELTDTLLPESHEKAIFERLYGEGAPARPPT